MSTPENGWPEMKLYVLGQIDDNKAAHAQLDDKLDTIAHGIDDIKDSVSAVELDIEVIKIKQDIGKGKISQKVFFFVVAVLLALLGADISGLLSIGG